LHELNALAAHLPAQGIDVVVPEPEQLDRERPLREWCLKFGFTAVPWAKLRDSTGITLVENCDGTSPDSPSKALRVRWVVSAPIKIRVFSSGCRLPSSASSEPISDARALMN